MIEPKEWTAYSGQSEKLEHLKSLGLIPATQNYIRQFIYSGPYVPEPSICTIEGYTFNTALVIKVCGHLHCIGSDCLAEMQPTGKRPPEEYVVLDLETTGLSPKCDEIIEFAGVKYRYGEEVESFETLIKPDCELSPLAEAVNGISSEMLSDAPCLEIALPLIYDFLGTTPIVAHNAPFDVRFLTLAYEAKGWKFDNAVFDTLKLAKKAFPNLSSYKLSKLKEEFNILSTGSHRALPDVQATAELFCICIDALAVKADDEISADEDISQKRNDSSQSFFGMIRGKHLPQVLTPSRTITDETHPLYDKEVVFTGDLSISRRDAAQRAVDVGAIVKNAVTLSTNFLVVGEQECQLIEGENKSGKEKKAIDYNGRDKADIQIINERDFFALLENTIAIKLTEKECKTNLKKAKSPYDYKAELEAYALVRHELERIVDDWNLPPECLIVKHLPDEKSSSETAPYLCIKLCESVICHYNFYGKIKYIKIPTECNKYIPSDTVPFSIESDKAYIRLPIEVASDAGKYTQTLCHVLIDAIKCIPKEFSCCSRYEQCSDAGKCIHPDRNIAKGCYYKKVLKSGQVFYGDCKTTQ